MGRRAVTLLLAGAVLRAAAGAAEAATVALPANAGAPPGGSETVALDIDVADGILGTSIVIRYDPAVARATVVATTPLSAGHALEYNLLSGEIRIALFGATPLQGGGALLAIGFDAVGPLNGRTLLDLVKVELNEGAIPAAARDGAFCVQGLPAEVAELRVGLAPPAGAALGWDAVAFATAYNVYRGNRPDLSDLVCLLPGVPSSPVTDPGVPEAGGVFVYLVSSVNCRSESGLGRSSAGAPRPDPVPCP